jgi:hypothetical protein
MEQGSAAVVIDRWTLAEELWLFGEDDLYRAPVAMSNREIIRVWELAGTLLPSARSSGEAGALAAVQLLDGCHRSLARSRRRPRSQLPTFIQTPVERSADLHRIRREESWPHRWD